MLKVAIMCHADKQWTEALPLVSLGIRTTYKEDLQSSAAEFINGETQWFPGEFLVPATPKAEPFIFIQQLRCHMNQLCPTPATRHASPATFIHKNLRDSTHILQEDTIRHALEPPYSGPHKVIACTDKTLKIVVCGQHVTVAADRVKPAYLLEINQHDTNNPPAQPNSTPTKPVPTPTQPIKTTRSGRNLRLLVCFAT